MSLAKSKPESSVTTFPPSNDIVDVATVEQQIEAHAQTIDRIQRDAIFEVGREFASIQDLHRYKRDDEGFTKFIARRFPQIPQSSAYQAIEIFKGISAGMFPNLGNIRPAALAEIAKAEPDVQALIAARVEAGEIFTAAQVKDLKAKAAEEAVERINADAEKAKQDLAALRSELATKDEKSAAEMKALQDSIAEQSAKLKAFEDQAAEFQKKLPKPAQAKEKAAEAGGVVLGSDGKFHSGSTAEQKRMHDAFMFAFDKLLDLTEGPPSAARVAAGCPIDERGKTIARCDQAIAYLTSIKEAVNGQ